MLCLSPKSATRNQHGAWDFSDACFFLVIISSLLFFLPVYWNEVSSKNDDSMIIPFWLLTDLFRQRPKTNIQQPPNTCSGLGSWSPTPWRHLQIVLAPLVDAPVRTLMLTRQGGERVGDYCTNPASNWTVLSNQNVHILHYIAYLHSSLCMYQFSMLLFLVCTCIISLPFPMFMSLARCALLASCCRIQAQNVGASAPATRPA